MAERCVAGEFKGSPYRAAAMPECIALGISYQSIEYHMGKINPVESASRVVADRARVEAEAAQAKAELIEYVFVERKGSASAAAAVLHVVDKLSDELNPQLMLAATLAREGAAATYQAEL
jgi:hypothetical protein